MFKISNVGSHLKIYIPYTGCKGTGQNGGWELKLGHRNNLKSLLGSIKNIGDYSNIFFQGRRAIAGSRCGWIDEWTIAWKLIALIMGTNVALVWS